MIDAHVVILPVQEAKKSIAISRWHKMAMRKQLVEYIEAWVFGASCSAQSERSDVPIKSCSLTNR